MRLLPEGFDLDALLAPVANGLLARNDLHCAEAIEAKSVEDGLIFTEADRCPRNRPGPRTTPTASSGASSPGYSGTGHPLSPQHERGGASLSADLHRDSLRQALPSQDPITAADLLKGRLVPFYDEHEVKLQRMLTYRGTEFCGSPERHYYQSLRRC